MPLENDARTAHVVLNPVAGRGKHSFFNLVIAYLKARGWKIEIYQTTTAGDAERVVSNYRGSAHLIIAAGGDGTVNEVINGLAENASVARHVLAIIPLGTTNVIASELDLPSSAKELAELIDSGNSCQCFWPQVNERRFAFSVGVGFDAKVVKGVSLSVKKYLGKLAYVMACVGPFLAFGGDQYSVEVQGREYKASSILISNGRYYAGRYQIAPKMKLEVPDVQLLLIDAQTPFQLLSVLVRLPFNSFEKSRYVTSLRAKTVTIDRVGSDESLQVDGDACSQLPLVIKSTAYAQSVICG